MNQRLNFAGLRFYRAKALAIVAGLLAALLPLQAQDLALKPAGEKKVDGRSWREYEGIPDVKLFVALPFRNNVESRLQKLGTVFSSFKAIKLAEIWIDSSDEADEITLLPVSISGEGIDMAANLPAGLKLRFYGALVYDFRVKSGDFLVRVRGAFMDEASLVGEMQKAIKNPSEFIAERDPSWAATRFTELEARADVLIANLEALRANTAAIMNKPLFGKPKALGQQLIASILEAKKLDPSFDRAKAVLLLKEKAITASAKEIDIVFRVWLGE